MSGPRVGRLLCLAGAALGALGILGWATGTTRLVTFLPGQPPMMPNTAVSLSLLGVAGALVHRQGGGARRVLALLAASVVLAVGLGTIAEYLLHVELHVDQLFIAVQDGPYPGRPSPPTALMLALLAVALLLFDFRPTARARPSEWLVVSAALVAFAAFVGQLFGAGPLYRLSPTPVIGVAVPTALSVLSIAVGLLLERPHTGLMRVTTSSAPGSIQLRRLLPVAILVPVLLGFVAARLLPAVVVEEFPLVFALMAVTMTGASLLLLVITAVPLNRTHQRLVSSRTRTRDLIEQASDGIFLADLEGRYTDVNGAGCRMLGYSRQDIVGKTIVDLIAPEQVAQLSEARQQLLAGQTHVAEWRLRRRDGSYVPVEVSAKILPDGRWQAFVRDISERKAAEDGIRQAQERYELALKGADLASWDWNVKTGEVIFNARWAELRGFRADEVRPHVDSWIDGVHPEDLPRVQRALSDCFRSATPDYASEHRVRTKAGEWIWILDRGRVFARDEHGQALRMVGTELDITEQKRAEAALRLAEARSSGILAVSADAIISIDDDQRITMFNEGAEKIFGYSRTEVLGGPFERLIPERYRAAHRQHVARFAASPDVARRMGERGTAISGLRKGGEEFPTDAAISKLDVGGRRLLTVALRDITQQKRVEDEQKFLAEVGAVLASTLDYEDLLIRVAELGVQGLADLCIVDVAQEREKWVRKVVSRDPSRASVCDLLMQAPIDGTHRHLIGSVMESQQPLVMNRLTPENVASFAQNEQHVRALRALDPQSLIALPLRARGKPLGVIALVSTTPSRVFGPNDFALAEEFARRAALSIENARLYRVLQRAIQARDDVLGIVAHDLRNPLGTILMQTTLLRQHGALPDRRSQKPADVIQRAATRMNRLIQDILDVTRIEAGGLSVEQTRVPARQVVADVVEAQKQLAASASIELRLDLAEDLPELCVDRDRLIQVFENLVGNAVKFTKPGGSITVGAAPRAGEVLLWVADTGSGIAGEHLPHLFDRFWQARPAGRRGAGLGLPIVKGIVEAHGGRIWVESTLGRGSTFFFTIPTAPHASDWHPEPAPHGP